MPWRMSVLLGGDNLTIRELAELCLRLLGKTRRVYTVPNEVILGVMKVATALGLPLPFNPGAMYYAVYYWFINNRKARRELGVEFRSAEETLQPTLEWLKQAGHIQALWPPSHHKY